MKKVILTTMIAAAMVASAFAQGSIAVSAGGGKVQFTTSADGSGTLTSVAAGSSPAVGTWGNLHMALYSATLGTPAPAMGANGVAIPSTWFIASPLVNSIGPIAGAILATTVTTSSSSGAGGAQVQAMMVAWTGNFANFNDALAAGTGLYSWSGRFGIGGTSWAQGTGNPFGTPPVAAAAIVAGATAFNGLRLAPVPEPGTMALIGLGAASLLIFRRRK